MKLLADPKALHASYVAARPFPHAVIDNLFPAETLETILAEFPRPEEIEWRRFDNATEKKLGYWHESALRPALQLFL
jgi:hypothetical protein